MSDRRDPRKLCDHPLTLGAVVLVCLSIVTITSYCIGGERHDNDETILGPAQERVVSLTPDEFRAIQPCLAAYWRQFDPTIPCWEQPESTCPSIRNRGGDDNTE